jgi:hypothetical protein
MRFTSTLALWLLTSIATTTALELQASTSACTTYITKPAECCPASSSHTTTSYTNCRDCALSTTIRGPHCDLVLTSHQPIFFSLSPVKLTLSQVCRPTTLPGTTTVTACSASPTCTSTITSTSPFGCTITVPPKTSTKRVDCGGCELETVTVANSLVGIGPVCVDGRTTVTGSSGRATVTACEVSGK